MPSKPNKKNTNTGAIKKTLVRNVQVSQPNHQNPPRVQRHVERASNGWAAPVNVDALFNHSIGVEKPVSKYQTPELQSCLEVAKKLEVIKSAPIPKANNLTELTPRAQAFVTEQVSYIYNNQQCVFFIFISFIFFTGFSKIKFSNR